MKKFAKSFFMAVTALMLLAGCSNIEENDATVSGMSEGGKAVIEIGIDGLTNSAARSARTINPAAYASTKKDFTKITLEGISENQAKLTSEDADGNEVDYIDLTSAFTSSDTASVTLDSGIWYLTLNAYEGSNLVLQGRHRVDTNSSSFTGSVSFSLSAEGVTTAGGINITVAFPSTVNVTGVSATATLYNIDTNEYISQDEDLTGFAYTKANLNPGRYSYTIKFFKNSKKMGVWGDVVVVAPGRTTTASVTLPDILAKKPNKPTNFHAYLVDGSERGDYYNVLFTWERDALKNEENFVITLNTYADTAASTTPVVYKIYGVENVAADKKEVFFESADRVAGSLNACEESCIIRLPTGTLFNATIKAQNFVGDSEEETRSSADAAATGTGIPANTPYAAEKINRVRITYNLNGGALTRTVGGSNQVTTGSLTVYDTYTGSAKALMQNTDTGFVSLQKDSLTPWKNEWLDGTTASSSPVSEYTWENLTVYANYDFEETDIDFSVADVWGEITAEASSASGGTWDASAKTLTITNNSKITFTAANELSTDTATITGIKYAIDGEEYSDEKSGSSIDFSQASKLSARVHTVVITATKDDGKKYGAVIYIDVRR